MDSVNEHNKRVSARHYHWVSTMLAGTVKVTREAEWRYLGLWDKHIDQINAQEAVWLAENPDYKVLIGLTEDSTLSLDGGDDRAHD